jgi:hypothetical protein
LIIFGIINKLFKKGGYLIIAAPNNEGFIKSVSNFCLNLLPHHVLHWTEKSLAFLSDKYNLDIEVVYRELVSSTQRESWYATIINFNINKLIHRNIRILDSCFFSKILCGVANIVAKVVKNGNFHKKANG